MTDFKSFIGSMSTRRRIATVVAVVGVAFVGTRLATLWPRDVAIAYEVGPEIEALDVDYLQAAEAVASVRFRRMGAETSVFRHTVRLQPGEYQVHITLHGQDGTAIQIVRQLEVPTRGVTRFELEAATGSSE
jgi:hypothetical protein